MVLCASGQRKEELEVTIVSPRGMEVALVESDQRCIILTGLRSLTILRDAWSHCKASDGMDYDQLEKVSDPCKEHAPCGQFRGCGEDHLQVRFLDMSYEQERGT